MSDLDSRIEDLTKAVTDLAAKAVEAQSGEKERYVSLKAELTDRSTELEGLLEEKRKTDLAGDIEALKAGMESLRPASKAARILAGASDEDEGDAHFGGFLKALWRVKEEGSPAAWAAFEAHPSYREATKATVGDTDANGGYIIPNNVVGQIIEIAKGGNIYRTLMDVTDGIRGSGVDQPYELDDSSLQRAQGQGGEATSYGSNKDTRDFTVGNATATLFPIARIIDVGNQLLRYSEGAAEKNVRSRLGRALALAEVYYILSGTGSNGQPKGILTSLAAASSSYATALSSESRAAAIGRGIGALETRSFAADAVVMTPTDWWELATETLGSSGSGGWVLAPGEGAASISGALRSFPLWGVPVYRDLANPGQTGFLTTGTALIAPWKDIDLYFGQSMRIDVSTESGNRFDRNLTGFRGEEEMAFNADAFVLTGMIQKVTGL